MVMNRKKKINQILKTKLKKQNAKLHKSNKPRYVSKAEREKLALEQQAAESQGETSQGEDCANAAAQAETNQG